MDKYIHIYILLLLIRLCLSVLEYLFYFFYFFFNIYKFKYVINTLSVKSKLAIRLASRNYMCFDNYYLHYLFFFGSVLFLGGLIELSVPKVFDQSSEDCFCVHIAWLALASGPQTYRRVAVGGDR